MTTQTIDRISYEGQSYPCAGLQLEPPKNDPRVPRSELPLVISTSMLRGYECLWAIHGDKLYLENIWGKWTLLDDKPAFADWVTGEIEVSLGDVIGHDFWGPIYERTLHLRVSEGVVRGSREVSNPIPPATDQGDA
jgi:hypothetical protein